MTNAGSTGSALSALERTYISLVVKYRTYEYIDNLIDEAIDNGETHILVPLEDIPSELTGESLENGEFAQKFIKILSKLGYDVHVAKNNTLVIDWLK